MKDLKVFLEKNLFISRLNLETLLGSLNQQSSHAMRIFFYSMLNQQ